jgi:hypothetical protein
MVIMIQRRASFRRRHSAWYTAYCMVKLDDTRIKVKAPARSVSRSVPAGGHGPMVFARMVKNAAKRPLKNISSDPSQIMTPTASMGGRSWTIFPCGAGISAETAWVTSEFLVHRAPNVPTWT